MAPVMSELSKVNELCVGRVPSAPLGDVIMEDYPCGHLQAQKYM